MPGLSSPPCQGGTKLQEMAVSLLPSDHERNQAQAERTSLPVSCLFLEHC